MSVYTQVVLSPDPLYLQPKSYDARSDRKWFADFISPGVVGASAYAVTATTSNMNISIAGGVAYVQGQNISDQGMYRQYMASASVLTVPGNNSGNPRIDTVIMRMMDTSADSSTFSEGRIEIVPGTPTVGATLANLTGIANLTTLGEASKSVLILCYVLVPNAATALTTVGNIRDARPQSGLGNAILGGVPVGATLEWNSSALPVGGFYLTEDGSAINRVTYSGAFNVLGTQHGVGDGSTTFNIPDSRGRSAVGYAPSGGHADVATLGATEGLALASRRMRHKHSIVLTDPGHGHFTQSNVNNGGAGNRSDVDNSNLTPNIHPTTVAFTGITLDVGPQTGSEPTDSAAYIVKHKIIRVI